MPVVCLAFSNFKVNLIRLCSKVENTNKISKKTGIIRPKIGQFYKSNHALCLLTSFDSNIWKMAPVFVHFFITQNDGQCLRCFSLFPRWWFLLSQLLCSSGGGTGGIFRGFPFLLLLPATRSLTQRHEWQDFLGGLPLTSSNSICMGLFFETILVKIANLFERRKKKNWCTHTSL